MTNIKSRSELTEDELTEFENGFNIFAEDHDGKLPLENVADLLRSMGLNPSNKDTQSALGDRTQGLPFDEFLCIYEELGKVEKGKNVTPEALLEGLKIVGSGPAGCMSREELMKILTTLGERLTEAEAAKALDNLGDSEGNIAYKDFVNAVLAG